ncbi:hypothetical protein H5410_052595 [Solanum commersonii]|uniref:U1-type domain-containing protein n=1 Tax=Solanum commersonii TaxID=4109 RepID=A0A9J5X4J8_SOLCO|nr:hypothetical protein H5410_052595 [Solanum commersonii]
MEDQSLKNETFLSVGYLEENGSDALEKHIANKTQCEGSGPVWEDITVMEHMAKHEAAEPKQVKSLKENPIIIEKKTKGLQVRELVVPADAEEIKKTSRGCFFRESSDRVDLCIMRNDNHLGAEHEVKIVKDNPIQIEKKMTGVKVKEMVVPAVVEEIKLPEVTSSKKVQTEWTCALCEMTTTLEKNMKSHLNGRKHKAKCEGLKTCEQTSKSDGSLPVPTKLNQFNLELATHVAAAQPEHSANEAAEPKQVKSVKEHPIQIEKKTTGVKIKDTEFPADAKEIKLPEINPLKNVQTEWTCACEELKRTAKSERNPPSTSNMPELKQKQVKHALAAQNKNSTNKKPKENVQLGATTGQHQRQTQVKNAGGATHNSKLWCSFCDIRCPDEIAHLNGKKHLAKLQERMSFTSGTWALNYANMQFYQGI